MKFIMGKLQSVFAMSPMFEVIRDSSIYGITRIIGVLIGLITIPIFAQIMSPDIIGLYSLALLTITISYQVVNEWIRSFISRYEKWGSSPESLNLGNSYSGGITSAPMGCISSSILVAEIIENAGLSCYFHLTNKVQERYS